jgi:membrane-associated phospholipid phosphatase
MTLAICVTTPASAEAPAPGYMPVPLDPETEPLPPPPQEPPAATGPRLVWNPKWPRFRAIGYALTGASIAGALAVTFLIKYPSDPRWIGGVLFDNAIRNAFRARSPGLRDGIRVASDITLFTTVVQTALVDGFLLPAADASWDIAWQLSLMNAQALSLNILIATLLFKAAARARPSYRDCQADPHFDPLCDTGSFASFPSSHTSTAFTAAGLTCIHHANLPLYGGQPWDSVACAGAITLATATGLFRIIGDRHYTSDVLVGAAIGFSLGYVYPWLFHYRFGDEAADSSSSELRWGLLPGTQGAPFGMSALGIF